MYAENKTTGSNRYIRVCDIPEECQLPNNEMVIEVKYRGDSNTMTGIALDKYIIPAIMNSLNKEEIPSTVYASMEIFYEGNNRFWEGRIFNTREERDRGEFEIERFRDEDFHKIISYINAYVFSDKRLDLIVEPVE